jgi:hypothetical protein
MVWGVAQMVQHLLSKYKAMKKKKEKKRNLNAAEKLLILNL